MKNKEEFWSRANRDANAMEYETVEGHITRSLMEQLKSDYKDADFDPGTGMELQKAIRRTKNLYDYAIGRTLPASGPERDAYNLALKRTMLNSVTWDTKFTVGGYTLVKADFGMVGAPGIISPEWWDSFPNKVDMYNRFKENIIPANALRKATKNERKLKQGSKDLITATNDALRSIKSHLATQSAATKKTGQQLLNPDDNTKAKMTPHNLNALNKFANQQ